MKDYIVKYEHYFRGVQSVQVRAKDKAQAIEFARETGQFKNDAYGGNVKLASLRVSAQKAIGKDKWKGVNNQSE